MNTMFAEHRVAINDLMMFQIVGFSGVNDQHHHHVYARLFLLEREEPRGHYKTTDLGKCWQSKAFDAIEYDTPTFGYPQEVEKAICSIFEKDRCRFQILNESLGHAKTD